MSLREAIHFANQETTTQNVWIPAWGLVLTRDRHNYSGGSPTDFSEAYGDLDITNSTATTS